MPGPGTGGGANIDSSRLDNFSRTIWIDPAQLSGVGTFEEQVCQYVNALQIEKGEVDSDIHIRFRKTLIREAPKY